MATLLTPQAAAIVGTLVNYTAADVTGNTFTPNTRGMLLVKNGSGGSINVTVVVPGTDAYSQARPDVVVAVAAAAEKAIGPFPLDLGDPANAGLITVTYSAVTSVTVALLSA